MIGREKMKINAIHGVKSNNKMNSSNVAFERKLKEHEKADYSQTINQAMDYLGIVNRAMVIHAPSFPASKKTDIDQGIGVPYGEGTQEFVNFLKLHGFNSVQLGPMGKLNRGDTAPYTSSVFAKNPLFIDAQALTTSEYGKILSNEELEGNTYEALSGEKNYRRVDYNDAQETIDTLMSIAYDNFQTKLNKKNKDAQNLNKQFVAFKNENNEWLEKYSVLDVIAKRHNTDFYPHWPQEDRELIAKVKKGDLAAKRTYNQIKKDNAAEIDKYQFIQFIIDKQGKESVQKGAITYIGDLLVGTSSFDELVYQDVFLSDYKIGAEGGGPNGGPQLWGFALLNPDKLFNKDGSLGDAGKFLQAKLKKAMSDTKNIRIDHVMGLVNPYIYKTTPMITKKTTDGTEYQAPKISGYLVNMGVDKNNNFARILPEIVIPTMLEMGVDPNTVVWEDLGWDPTGAFYKVFKDKLDLHGISGLLWTKGEDAKNNARDNWAYIGCHDNPPAQKIAKEDERVHGEWKHAWDTSYLAQYNNSRPITKKAAQAELEKDTKKLVNAKFADLMNSTKNIQISFMDFFGIDKAYNTPGTTGGDNWTLRLNPTFEDEYHKSLENNGYALNMPEVLAQAIKAQGKNTKQVNQMLDKLNHYSEVLKEKE